MRTLFILLFTLGSLVASYYTFADEIVVNNKVKKNAVKNEKVTKGSSSAENRTEKLKRLLAQNKDERNQNSQIKHLSAKIVELKDSTGLIYVGAAVNKTELSGFLAQMKTFLGEDKFQLFRANQLARDLHGFHVTLINPFEYQTINKAVKFGQTIRLTLQGLGKVVVNDAHSPQKNAESYFIVTTSADGQFFRQQYLLKPKDFHITLGFNPHDIYSMSKGKERLIK